MSASQHSLDVPEQGTYADMSEETVIRTSEGNEVWVGDTVQFERFPNANYRLQAFHEAWSEERCFADFHVSDPTNSDKFVIGFDMSWETLADALDEGNATVVEKA